MANWGGVNGMSKGSHEPALGRMLGFGRSGCSVWLIGQAEVSLQVYSGVLTPDSVAGHGRTGDRGEEGSRRRFRKSEGFLQKTP